MRVVLDTNILVSALLIQLGIPAAVYRAWHEGHFTLLTCPEQLNELRATLSKPALAARIKPPIMPAAWLTNSTNLPRPSDHCRASNAHPTLPMISFSPYPKRAKPTTW